MGVGRGWPAWWFLASAVGWLDLAVPSTLASRRAGVGLDCLPKPPISTWWLSGPDPRRAHSGFRSCSIWQSADSRSELEHP